MCLTQTSSGQHNVPPTPARQKFGVKFFWTFFSHFRVCIYWVDQHVIPILVDIITLGSCASVKKRNTTHPRSQQSRMQCMMYSSNELLALCSRQGMKSEISYYLATLQHIPHASTALFKVTAFFKNTNWCLSKAFHGVLSSYNSASIFCLGVKSI